MHYKFAIILIFATLTSSCSKNNDSNKTTLTKDKTQATWKLSGRLGTNKENGYDLVYAIAAKDKTYVTSSANCLMFYTTDGITFSETIHENGELCRKITSLHYKKTEDMFYMYGNTVAADLILYKSKDGINFKLVQDITLKRVTVNATTEFNGYTFLVGFNSGTGEPYIGRTKDHLTFENITPENLMLGGIDSVVSHNGLIVVAAVDGVLVSKDSGQSWTIPIKGRYVSVTHGLGRFIAVGSNGKISHSADGLKWEKGLQTNPEGHYHVGLNCSKTECVIASLVSGGNGKIITFTKPDASDWKIVESSGNYRGQLKSVLFKDEMFFVTGQDLACVEKSPDLQVYKKGKWNSYKSALKYSEENVNDSVFFKKLFIAITEGGSIYTSANGSDWVSRYDNKDMPLKSISIGENSLIAVGSKGNILFSKDGKKWSQKKSPFQGDLIKSTYFAAQKKYVVLSQIGQTLISNDGVKWTLSKKLPQGMSDLAAGGKTLVVVGSKGQITYTTDLLNWKSSTVKNFEGNFNSIQFANEQFVAAGSKGEVRVSKNGSSWKKQDSILKSDILKVGTLLSESQGEMFFATDGKKIMESKTGTDWKQVNSMLTEPRVTSILSNDKKILMFGNNGMVFEKVRN